ncbi:unnamed protein product [Ectocarpus sp. 12 AP-2014]
MALERYVMPSDASRRDAHHPDTTLVEGYVVEHALRWKSNSVAGYLNAGGGIDVGAGAPADVAQLQRAPKVSVTLSEYLSAASPHADPSCDYGWYTPTASASSLPAAENSPQEGCYPAPPSPSAYPSSLPWRCNRVEVESTVTVAVSPESIVLGGDGGGGSSTKVHEASSGRGKNLPLHTPPYGFEENRSSSNKGGGGSFSTRKPQQQQEQQQLALVPRSSNVSFGGGIGWGRGGDSSGAGASGQRLIEANAAAASAAAESSAGSIGVRLLPVKKARSTTTHLNSWHPLYPMVSSSGRLSAESCSGKCTMHIRRTSFSISTRHFPEKPPTPPNKKRRSDRIARGGSSWGSGRPLSGSPLLQGRGRDRAAAAAAAILKEEEQQQQQQRESPKASRPKSYSWAVTEIRVIRPDLRFPLGPAPPYAQYLVVVCMGREKLVAGWRRASDFEKLAAIARKAWMPKSCVAWEALERARRVDGGGPCNMPVVLRPRRLDSVYLQNKARFLEEFLKQYFFEAGSKDALLSFLDLKKPATAEV